MENTLTVNLIKAFGFEALSPEEQADVMERIGEVVNQRILIRAISELQDADKDSLNTFLATDPSYEAIFEFLRGKLADFDVMVREESDRFKEESMEFMSRVTQKN